MPRRRLSPGAKIGLGALLVVALALVVWTVVAALLARSHLQQVKDDLLALGDHPPKDAQTLDKRLARDQGRARAAKRLMHQSGPVAVAWLPLVGRSLVAERTVADASVS